VEFVVIGNSDGKYGAEVEAILAACASRVVRLPTQRYFDLAQYYQAADMALFPKQCSMSFFEAQSCGLPVVFERNEINNQRAAFENAFVFAPGSEAELRSKIEWLAALPAGQLEQLRANARDYVLRSYDYVPIARRFTDVLQRAVDAWRAKGARA
jgi:glycosyltransferase involved in cell wall biosynthesis